MQKNKTATGILAGVLVPMGIICLFALGSLVLALYGGRVYKSVQTYADNDFETTVTANYLRTKLLQNNKQNAISIATVDGIEMLVIVAEAEEGLYETRIFVQNGQLMESFTSQSKAFDAKDAVPLAAVRQCDFSISDSHLFVAEIVSENGAYTRVAFALAEGDGS